MHSRQLPVIYRHQHPKTPAGKWALTRASFLRTLLMFVLATAPLPAFAQTPAQGATDTATDPKLAAQITALLDQADAATARGQLIYPLKDSALALFEQILQIDPGNADAQLGLTLITEQYLEEAQLALERNDLFSADIALSQARVIYPDYPGLAVIERRMALEETASRTREVLDWREVAQRSSDLAPRLIRLGKLAKAGDCRVTIHVSNDNEGRWVYQQMNKADGAERIRAEVRISSPAAVEVRCFQENQGDSD